MFISGVNSNDKSTFISGANSRDNSGDNSGVLSGDSNGIIAFPAIREWIRSQNLSLLEWVLALLELVSVLYFTR